MKKSLSTHVYIAVWLLLAVVFGCLLGWRIPKLIELKETGIPLEAEVVSVTPDFHNTFRYSFVVDSKKYEGVSQIIDAAPRLGQKVAITYLPASPDFSYAGDIQGQIDNDRISAILAGIIFPTFAVVCYVLRNRS